MSLQYRVLLLPTPTAAGHLEFTIATSVEPAGRGRLGSAGVPVDEVADVHAPGRGRRGPNRTNPSGKGLRYVDHPRLMRGDGPIPRFRHWARQFHPPAVDT